MIARNDEIRARLAAATPGPWAPKTMKGVNEAGAPAEWATVEMAGDPFTSPWIVDALTVPDSQLIANAPADIAHLLALVEAAATLLEAEGYTRTADGLRRGALPDVMTGAGVR